MIFDHVAKGDRMNIKTSEGKSQTKVVIDRLSPDWELD